MSFFSEGIPVCFHVVIPNIRDPTLRFQSNPFAEVRFGGAEGVCGCGRLARAKGEFSFVEVVKEQLGELRKPCSEQPKPLVQVPGHAFHVRKLKVPPLVKKVSLVL